MKKIIHVNRHNIAKNKKGDSQPVLSVKTYNTNVYGNNIQIKGPCRLVYNPDKPLSCGATVWIETYSEVEIEL